MTKKTSRAKLFYLQSASEWEEALPVGNGRIGAMVFGHIQKDRFQLNEDTLWSGYPRDTNNYEALRYLKKSRELIAQGQYAEAEALIEQKMLAVNCQAYQPFGDLYVEWFNAPTTVHSYERTLELATAVATTEIASNGQLFTREAWVSATDGVMALSYKSSKQHPMDLKASFEMGHPAQFEVQGNRYVVNSKCPTHIADNYFGDHSYAIQYEEGKGVIYQSQLQVESDGEVTLDESGASVTGATYVIFYLSIATSFTGFQEQPHQNYSKLAERNAEILGALLGYTYEELKQKHIAEHARLFNRVSFELLEDEPKHHFPTDQRLELYKQGEQDLALESLYFHYGRYLLITSSRPGTQPANLQGIWNHHITPPWNSDYTTNINAQMNYWPAELTSLSECHEPLLNMVEELTVTGASTAKIHYHADGWVTHHNVDLWRMSSPTAGHPSWAFWPMGGVWLTQHMWERYLFHPNLQYLEERAYPVMKGAAKFCLDWLVKDKNGQYKLSPSSSPENKFEYGDGKVSSVAENSAMDITLVRELFMHVIEAATLLDIDDEFRSQLEDTLAHMPQLQINEAGLIQEWSTDFVQHEPGHRHVSHLYGLYPGTSIQGEELVEATKQSLASRIASGGGHTGWSCAWLINLYARLRRPNDTYKFIRTLLARSTYPNLFDAHPPFQIDGNFGGTAGMVEALVQSHHGVIELLPALPQEWQAGSIQGLTARGGFKLSIAWQSGKLMEASIVSLYGMPLKVNSDQNIVIVDVESGDRYSQNEVVLTSIGGTYTVHLL